MRIVLRMAGNERDAFVFTGEQVGIAVFRFGQDFQVGVIADQLCRKIGVARMRGQESVIETTRQQRMRMKNVVFVYARKFVAAGSSEVTRGNLKKVSDRVFFHQKR
ncbi:hypothetical protein ENC_04420 [Enterobacter hormaechei]|nr:hypothetical protein ENC_04420 [Enterobacter hormaechei]